MHSDTQLIIAGVACTPTIVAAIEQDGSKLAAMPDMKPATNGDWINVKHLAKIVQSEVTRVDPVVVHRSGPDEVYLRRLAQLEKALKLLDERDKEIEGLKLEVDEANKKHADTISEWRKEVEGLKTSLDENMADFRAAAAASRDTQLALRVAENVATNLRHDLAKATMPISESQPKCTPVEPTNPWKPIPRTPGIYVYWDGAVRSDRPRLVHIDGYGCEEESGDHARAGFYQQITLPTC